MATIIQLKTVAGTGATALKGYNISTVPLADGDQAVVSGYHADGDGGGGIFYLNLSDSTTDNDGTIFQAYGGTGDNRWYRLDQRTTNLRQWGAKGDYNTSARTGTDDTRRIQAALDWWKGQTNPCRTLEIGPGNYRVNGSLLVEFSATAISDLSLTRAGPLLRRRGGGGVARAR